MYQDSMMVSKTRMFKLFLDPTFKKARRVDRSGRGSRRAGTNKHRAGPLGSGRLVE
jgi:hypothetical protein